VPATSVTDALGEQHEGREMPPSFKIKHVAPAPLLAFAAGHLKQSLALHGSLSSYN